MEKSVLITSHTHSAVDNVLVRLRKCDADIKFMRLGASKRIRAELRDCSEEAYTSTCKTPDELTNIYSQFVSILEDNKFLVQLLSLIVSLCKKEEFIGDKWKKML